MMAVRQRNRASLKWGHGRVREAVCTGERILTPAPMASRHALLLCGENTGARTACPRCHVHRRDGYANPLSINGKSGTRVTRPSELLFLDALNSRAELPQLHVHVLVAAVEVVNPVYLRCAFRRETGNHQ